MNAPGYAFNSSELVTFTCIMYGNLWSETDRLPTILWSDTFLHWTNNGQCTYNAAITFSDFFQINEIHSALFVKTTHLLVALCRCNITALSPYIISHSKTSHRTHLPHGYSHPHWSCGSGTLLLMQILLWCWWHWTLHHLSNQRKRSEQCLQYWSWQIMLQQW